MQSWPVLQRPLLHHSNQPLVPNSSNNTHEEDEHPHMQGPDGVQCAQQ